MENSNFIAINKPAGLSVHNDDESQSSVLEIMGKNLHLAHRLDKETSGILVVAKTSVSAAGLMKALGEGSSQKQYSAILRGNLKKQTPESKFPWKWPISDKAEGRQNPQGKSQDRVNAETTVEVLQSNSYFTSIKAHILTGRQHQIRKHAAIAKHPIVGDPRYNDKNYNSKIFSIYKLERMFLHAERLQFSFESQDFDITAPVPDIFQALFSNI
jgi:tRNA pseudouridine65 synthase